MTDVIIPLDLFDDLIENTQHLLNEAEHDGDQYYIEIFKKELGRCKEIQKELSKDN